MAGLQPRACFADIRLGHIERAAPSALDPKWGLALPRWQDVEPGAGVASGRPFLEIGNFALRHFVHTPPGYHRIDLAREWTSWTGLPFVFAVWIVRRTQTPLARKLLAVLQRHITTITQTVDQHFSDLSLLLKGRNASPQRHCNSTGRP